MSKIGKKPIQIPKDTKVKVEAGKLILSGPKGSKELSINDKWLSTRQIYNKLQNYYICALKNRYIQNLNDNMNLYYIEDNKNSEYEMLSYYKKQKELSYNWRN